MNRAFQNYIAALFAALAATLASYLVWGMAVAYYVSFLAPALVFAVVLVHIVCFDSRKRWPDKTASQRLAAVIAHQR